MTETKRDSGVIAVLMDRLGRRRIPKLLALRKKLKAGNPLTDFELGYLINAVEDTRQIIPLIDRYPEYHTLWSQVMVLYKEISDLATEMEDQTKI